MKPVSFKQQNTIYNKPEDMTDEQCGDLPAHRFVSEDKIPYVISCWELSPEELEQIKTTGKVWLTVCAYTMPPVSIDVTTPFLEA